MKTKNNAVKKVSSKKRALVCAEGGQCFWTSDGRVLANLAELKDALSSMADDVFKHHVTKEKNDFADWIEFVLLDSAVAADVRKAKKPATAKTAVSRGLKEYDL